MPANVKRQDAALRRNETIRLKAIGYTNQAVADQLGVSLRTIGTYLADIRAETYGRIANPDEVLAESMEHYQMIERKALEKGSYRIALEARTCIVRLLGLARPSRVDVRGEIQHTGRLQVEYLRPKPDHGVSISVRPAEPINDDDKMLAA